MKYHDVAEVRHKAIYWITNFFLNCWVRIGRRGLDNVEKARRLAGDKGVIFAIVPHLSYIDVLFVPALISKEALPIRYIASAKFFTRAKKGLFYKWGAIPAEKQNGKVNNFGIEKSCDFLDKGINVGIFPQARFPMGKLKPLRMRYGVAVIAQQSGVPVVPVHIIGTGRVVGADNRAELIPSHKDWKFYLGLSRMKITFYNPIMVNDYGDKKKNRVEQKKLLARLDEIVKIEYPAKSNMQRGEVCIQK